MKQTIVFKVMKIMEGRDLLTSEQAQQNVRAIDSFGFIRVFQKQNRHEIEFLFNCFQTFYRHIPLNHHHLYIIVSLFKCSFRKTYQAKRLCCQTAWNIVTKFSIVVSQLVFKSHIVFVWIK